MVTMNLVTIKLTTYVDMKNLQSIIVTKIKGRFFQKKKKNFYFPNLNELRKQNWFPESLKSIAGIILEFKSYRLNL